MKKQQNNIIYSFKGKYYFLSNFYISPFIFFNYEFKSVEHFYQAFKCKYKKDFIKIIQIDSPKEVKKYSKNIKIRDDWFKINDIIMYTGLKYKFKNYELQEKLLQTENAYIIENNTWHDNYWGNCICEKCKKTKGLNKLGKFLMTIRNEIKTNKLNNNNNINYDIFKFILT